MWSIQPHESRLPSPGGSPQDPNEEQREKTKKEEEKTEEEEAAETQKKGGSSKHNSQTENTPIQRREDLDRKLCNHRSLNTGKAPKQSSNKCEKSIQRAFFTGPDQ